MIPIRDINPRARTPWVNYGLLGVVAVVFAGEIWLQSDLAGLLLAWAFVPADLTQAVATKNPQLLSHSLLTMLLSVFLHGGWFHVAGNLVYLRVFGDNVEDRLGHLGYLIFFLAAGVSGSLAQYLVNPDSPIAIVGASGAISGVLGAYIVMFPKVRVVTLVPIFVFLSFLELPVYLFVGIWGLQQFLNGYLSLLGGELALGDVAWFAHIGGFAFGVAVGIVYRLTNLRGGVKRARRKKR